MVSAALLLPVPGPLSLGLLLELLGALLKLLLLELLGTLLILLRPLLVPVSSPAPPWFCSQPATANDRAAPRIRIDFFILNALVRDCFLQHASNLDCSPPAHNRVKPLVFGRDNALDSLCEGDHLLHFPDQVKLIAYWVDKQLTETKTKTLQ